MQVEVTMAARSFRRSVGLPREPKAAHQLQSPLRHSTPRDRSAPGKIRRKTDKPCRLPVPASERPDRDSRRAGFDLVVAIENQPSPRALGPTQKTRGSDAGSAIPSDRLAWIEPPGSTPRGCRHDHGRHGRAGRSEVANSRASSSIGLVVPST